MSRKEYRFTTTMSGHSAELMLQGITASLAAAVAQRDALTFDELFAVWSVACDELDYLRHFLSTTQGMDSDVVKALLQDAEDMISDLSGTADY